MLHSPSCSDKAKVVQPYSWLSYAALGRDCACVKMMRASMADRLMRRPRKVMSEVQRDMQPPIAMACTAIA